MKKLFRLVLLFSLTAMVLALSAMAADTVPGGECGDNLKWTLDSDGLLTISGTGAIWTSEDIPNKWNANDIKSINIEYGVTSIGVQAFAGCTNLTEVDIPDTVTSIGAQAFSSCSNLTKVTLPKSLTKLESMAFASCSNLSSAVFEGDVPSTFGESVFIGYADNFKISYYGGSARWTPYTWTAPDGTVYNTIQLDENVPTPPSITANGHCGDDITWTLYSDGLLTLTGSGDMWDYTDNEEAPSPFIEYRKMIKTISIADGITSVGSTAFVDCDNLTEVEFPASVTTIGSRSFQNCDSLTAITLNNGLTHLKDHAFEFCKNLAAVSLPDTLKYIGEKAFAECEALTAIALPASLEEIGANPFCLCKSLATITVASDNEDFTADNNVLYNKEQTTLYVDPNVVVNEIKHYTVPDGVVRIADRAYSNCQSLLSVTFPASLTTVGDRAFQNCENLSTIVFSDGLKTIEGWAFEYCSGLTGLTLPEGLETIGSRAFQCCTGMTGITFPKTLANIGDNVFDECPQLVSATFNGNVPGSWSDDVFGTVNVNPDLIIRYYDGYTNWTTPTWTAPDTNKTVYNTFKLSEGNPPAEPGSYTVSLSAPNDVTVGSTFTVAATANQVFSAAELTLVYNETALTFVGVEPALTGNAANENGTVTLIDFGHAKTGYVFTFTANTVGSTEIGLTSAKFSTADDAANSDLKDAVITNNSVTVTVKTPTLNVELGEFLSGEQTVETGSNYTFYLTGDTEYYNYAITATMGGENVSIIDNGDNSYTIANVTADLVITATRTAKTYSITMIGTDGTVLETGTISYGSSFAKDIPQEAYYTVSVESVTYDEGGAPVPYIYENDVITIDKTYITGNITITIKKVLILNAECKEYLTLDGTALWLVTNKTSEVIGKTYTYNGTAMYWSDKYDAYCTLVVSEEQPNIDAECFALINESAASVDYGMDVNKSGKVDANDAQLAYNMYRPMYSGISSDITVEKYLRADVNGDKTVNTMDAAAIVNYILNIN